jgi:hypothetical protein
LTIHAGDNNPECRQSKFPIAFAESVDPESADLRRVCVDRIYGILNSYRIYLGLSQYAEFNQSFSGSDFAAFG